MQMEYFNVSAMQIIRAVTVANFVSTDFLSLKYVSAKERLHADSMQTQILGTSLDFEPDQSF